MQKLLALTLIWGSAFPAIAQLPSAKYQPGTIMAVVRHLPAEKDVEPNIAHYEVSVRIGSVVYVVLYTPPNGANAVEYSAGMQMLFLVGDKTLTFNSRLSGTTVVPILRQGPADQSGLDWSKAPAEYFNLTQQQMSTALSLTTDQEDKIKPVLEQETGEIGALINNPVLSRKTKLKKYEQITDSSDARIKPLLSAAQSGQLLELRKRQKAELKKLVREQTARHD
jgi:hypothetical protein